MCWASLGNDFNGITIQSKEVIERAKKSNYPFTTDKNTYALKSPDGYTFYVVDEIPDGAGEWKWISHDVKINH